MALLIAAPTRDTDELAETLNRLEPGADIRVWPDAGELSEIDFAICWKQPEGLFSRLPGLKAVTSLGAGVDGILKDPDLPRDLPVGRLAGPRLASNMAAYVTAMTTLHWRDFPGFMKDQAARRWNQWAPEHPPVVGLMGMGEMARMTASALEALDTPVHGWNRSGKGPDTVTMHSGDRGLVEMAATVDVLVCLLPLTDQTRGIIHAGLLAAMKPGACLINTGRGEHLVEADLLSALDAGRPGRAILDVFSTEPLPESHPFWQHPRILITPHCASITLTEEAARLALESWRRVQAGKPPLGQVEPDRGY